MTFCSGLGATEACGGRRVAATQLASASPKGICSVVRWCPQEPLAFVTAMETIGRRAMSPALTANSRQAAAKLFAPDRSLPRLTILGEILASDWTVCSLSWKCCRLVEGACRTNLPDSTTRRLEFLFMFEALAWLLAELQRSLGGPLHSSDGKGWRLAASSFEEDASTVGKYETFGRRHPFLFQSGGLQMQQAIDPRT